MKKYKFIETEADPLAYSCDNFGDNSGEYVKAEEAERKIEELRAIALEAMYRLRMIGDHDYGVSDYAKKHEEILSKRLEAIGE